MRNVCPLPLTVEWGVERREGQVPYPCSCIPLSTY